jgi:hypothetical protein
LWRIHAAVPRKGIVGVFNRSQYEEVLVVKVHQYASAEHIEAAYQQINDFERLLAGNGTIIPGGHPAAAARHPERWVQHARSRATTRKRAFPSAFSVF